MNLAVLVRVAALALVYPELLGHGVFHGAGVLAAHLVVRNPPVLRCRFAVGGQFGFVVDGGAGVVVFHPPGVPQVAYVHVQALEADAGGDDVYWSGNTQTRLNEQLDGLCCTKPVR